MVVTLKSNQDTELSQTLIKASNRSTSRIKNVGNLEKNERFKYSYSNRYFEVQIDLKSNNCLLKVLLLVFATFCLALPSPLSLADGNAEPIDAMSGFYGNPNYR